MVSHRIRNWTIGQTLEYCRYVWYLKHAENLHELHVELVATVVVRFGKIYDSQHNKRVVVIDATTPPLPTIKRPDSTKTTKSDSCHIVPVADVTATEVTPFCASVVDTITIAMPIRAIIQVVLRSRVWWIWFQKLMLSTQSAYYSIEFLHVFARNFSSDRIDSQ